MKKKTLFCLIFLFSFLNFCTYAQDNADVSLFEIDNLIKKTQYDDALKLLHIYIKHNPENFDNAQARIKRIMNAKKQYSILAERLIKLIQTDPGNSKEIYEITAQLEKFEKYPSDQNLQFIADLKKSAEFNYFRAQFLEIQNQTAKQSESGEYLAAVKTAKSGFWLYCDDFYEKWENNAEIVSEANNCISNLDVHIKAFEDKNFLPKINNAVNDFIKAVSSEQYDNAVHKFDVVRKYFNAYGKLRNQLIDDGISFQLIYEKMKTLDKNLTDASYMPFLFRLTLGVDSIENSGILGAIDCFWNDSEKKMNDAVFEALKKQYESYKVSIDDAFAKNVGKYSDLQTKVLDLYKLSDRDDKYKLENKFSEYYAVADYVKNISLRAVEISEVAKNVSVIEGEEKAFIAKTKSQKDVASSSALMDKLFNYAAAIGKSVGVKKNLLIESYDWAAPYLLLGRTEWSGLSELYTKNLDTLFENVAAVLSELWSEIAENYKNSSDKLYDAVYEYYESADKYREGFFTKMPSNIYSEISNDASKSVAYQNKFDTNSETNFEIRYSYPDLAIKIAGYTQQQVEQAIKKIDTFEKEIDTKFNSNKQLNSEDKVIKIISDAKKYLDGQKEKLASLKNDSEKQASLARAKFNAAQLAKNEADIRYNEAETALKNNNFDEARKKLQAAVYKYDESLENQEDEKLRNYVDRVLLSLGERIAKAENEIVVHEVRILKTQAKDAYFNGRFEDAEKLLTQAKQRWAVTNLVEDEEIRYLLNFINMALSMQSGREILPSAPQYPEMSQLLSMANKYFDEGSRKITSGDKAGGYADLDLALESVQKLQYVYPLNQEASILTLKINKLKDPEKFRSELSQKIKIAENMCKNTETRREGYANLLDYYQLEPGYKGLKELIYKIEIEIGIRQKPVDNSSISKAQKLLRESQAIFDSAGNNRKKLEDALTKIDKAIVLLPYDETAIKLKDKIITKIGGNTSTVLSIEDERLYQLAIQRLQNNNIMGANAIVEQLLRKSQNAGSQKIKELKNKIEARS